jgi:hypothetical protein
VTQSALYERGQLATCQQAEEILGLIRDTGKWGGRLCLLALKGAKISLTVYRSRRQGAFGAQA